MMKGRCKEHGELKLQWGFCPYCGKPADTADEYVLVGTGETNE